jgi:DNA polymerase V
LGELWGVGRERSAHFLKDQLRTVADFLAVPESVVNNRYGLEGKRLWAELMGKQAYSLTASRPIQKSIMSTRSFAKASTDAAVVEDSLRYHLHQLVADLAAMGLEAGAIRVLIAPGRHSTYALQAASKEAVLLESTADIFVLQKVVRALFLSIFKPGVPYKRAGIVATRLVSPRAKTASLFGDSSADVKTATLTSTLLEINHRLGAQVMQMGRLPNKTPIWSVKCDLLSPAYTTSWKDLKVVQAKS